MGGQACVFYGAAEFSRDTDLAILARTDNLARLKKTLKDLQAEVIAVPPFEAKYLRKGHAVHFRCHHPEAAGMRVDVMTKMRGVDSFPKLWDRRTTLSINGETIELMSLSDLVQAKKTQRDKDWPMLRRLVEVNYFENRKTPTREQIRFLAQLLGRVCYGETPLDEAGRDGIRGAGEAGLFAADRDSEITWLDHCPAVIADHSELAWLDGELDHAALARFQMYALDPGQ